VAWEGLKTASKKSVGRNGPAFIDLRGNLQERCAVRERRLFYAAAACSAVGARQFQGSSSCRRGRGDLAGSTLSKSLNLDGESYLHCLILCRACLPSLPTGLETTVSRVDNALPPPTRGLISADPEASRSNRRLPSAAVELWSIRLERVLVVDPQSRVLIFFASNAIPGD
jgi:hypothetical protein